VEADEERLKRVGRLKPEVKVNMAIGMSDVCVRVCADGVRDQNPGIGEEELIDRVRERIEWSKRWQKHRR
jgi:hypothetical protein